MFLLSIRYDRFSFLYHEVSTTITCPSVSPNFSYLEAIKIPPNPSDLSACSSGHVARPYLPRGGQVASPLHWVHPGKSLVGYNATLHHHQTSTAHAVLPFWWHAPP